MFSAESALLTSHDRQADLRLLDNPIWNALSTEHAHLALGNTLAKRYPKEIGPLSGFRESSAAGYEALRELAGSSGIVGLFLEEVAALPAGWTMMRDGTLYQMIDLRRDSPKPISDDIDGTIVQLTLADVPEMIALAHLTEPGPFESRTHELGTFFGIRDGEGLAAMAGERMRLPGFTEVSAVCTHPRARGRGYAKALTAYVAGRIRQRGITPILHLFAANTPALRVYESIGFTVRRTLELAVIRNDR